MSRLSGGERTTEGDIPQMGMAKDATATGKGTAMNTEFKAILLGVKPQGEAPSDGAI